MNATETNTTNFMETTSITAPNNFQTTTSPLECFQSTDPSSYRGSTAVTQTGLICQAWNSQKPHKHI